MKVTGAWYWLAPEPRPWVTAKWWGRRGRRNRLRSRPLERYPMPPGASNRLRSWHTEDAQSPQTESDRGGSARSRTGYSGARDLVAVCNLHSV
jgi:hypothetical protein